MSHSAGVFVIKSALDSISFNSLSIRLKATEKTRHNGWSAAAGKPGKSDSGDIDDTDRLTL